jgi:hypothetical protein
MDIKTQGTFAEQIAYRFGKRHYADVIMSSDPYDQEKDMEFVTETGIKIPVEVKGTAPYVVKRSIALEVSQLPKLMNAANVGKALIITPEVSNYPCEYSGKICQLVPNFKYHKEPIKGKQRLMIPFSELEIIEDIPTWELKVLNAISSGLPIPTNLEGEPVVRVDIKAKTGETYDHDQPPMCSCGRDHCMQNHRVNGIATYKKRCRLCHEEYLELKNKPVDFTLPVCHTEQTETSTGEEIMSIVTREVVNGFEIVTGYVPARSRTLGRGIYPWSQVKLTEAIFVPKEGRVRPPSISMSAKSWGKWSVNAGTHRGQKGWFITKIG